MGVDPSAAAGGLDDFDAELDAATEKWHNDFVRAGEDTEPLGRSLIDKRETARLLSEELGIHLPRAVTSAVAEMLPAIEMLGPALLGAFAVMEIPKIISGLQEASDSIAGFDKQARTAFAEVVKASDKAYTHFKDLKDGINFRREVNQNIAALETERAVLDKTGGSALNYARGISELMMGLVVSAETHIAMARREATITEDLVKLEKKRFEMLEQTTTLEVKEHKKAEEARRHAAAAAAAAAREAMAWAELMAHAAAEDERLSKRVQTWHDEWLKALGMPEEAKFNLEEIVREFDSAGLAAAKSLPPLQGMSEAVTKLTAAQRVALPTLQETKNVQAALLKVLPDLTAARAKELAQQLAAIPVVRAIGQETGDEKIKHDDLTRAILNQLVAEKELTQEQAKQIAAANGISLSHQKTIVGLKQLKDVTDAFNKSTQEGLKAVEADTEALQGIAAEAGGLIKSKKARAEIEGAFDAAKAIEEMAVFIASGGTNGAALAASIQYGLASAEFFKVAGGGGSSAGGGRGAGATRGSDRSAGGDNLTATAPSGSTSASTAMVTRQPGGGNLHVMVLGEPEGASYVAGILNNHVQNAGGALFASHVNR